MAEEECHASPSTLNRLDTVNHLQYKATAVMASLPYNYHGYILTMNKNVSCHNLSFLTNVFCALVREVRVSY